MENLKEEITRLIHDANSLKWVPLSAMQSGEHLSCIDGRHHNCIVGAPGGDTGVFIAVIAAFEQQCGVLSDQYIDIAVSIVMEWHPKFYMHSDAAAVERLFDFAEQKLDAKLRLDETKSDWVRNPPKAAREGLLNAVVNPSFVGCGFIKAMLLDPDGFKVRKGLVETVIRSFFTRLWNGAMETQFEILPGEHEERAVVVVKTRGGDVSPTSFVPALKGIEEGPSRLFFFHDSASNYVTHQTIALFARAGHLPVELDFDQSHQDAEALCKHQLGRIVTKLAGGLPMFEVSFDNMGENPQVAQK